MSVVARGRYGSVVAGPVVIVLLALGVAGIVPPAASQALPEIRVAFNREFQNLDPAYRTGAPDLNLLTNIFNGLVRYKFDSTDIEGDLAERWTVTDGGRTLTFLLRRNVVWQKGYGPFTAADVKYSLERIKNDEKSPFASSFAHVQSIETPDPHTVRIRMTRPFGAFLTAILPQTGFIMHRAAVDLLGPAFSTMPVGTGPFTPESYERRQHITLAANPSYFRGAPAIKRVVWRVIPDETVAGLALQRNAINYMIVRDPTVFRTLKSARNVCVQATPAIGYALMLFNVQQAPVSDVRVRRATAHAINRRSLAESIGEGMASVGSPSLIPPGMFGHTDNITRYPFDPSRAKRLLAEAGFADGVEFVLMFRANVRDQATALQRFLGDVGIRVKLDQVEQGIFVQRRQSGDFHALLTEPTRNDPDGLLEIWDGRNARPHGTRNESGYNGVDDLIDQFKFETDQDKRRATLALIQQKMSQDVPAIVLWNPVYATAFQCDIKSHERHTGFWMTRFEFMRFEK